MTRKKKSKAETLTPSEEDRMRIWWLMARIAALPQEKRNRFLTDLNIMTQVHGAPINADSMELLLAKHMDVQQKVFSRTLLT